MKRRDLILRSEGLYRCCVQTASEWAQEAPDEPVQDGEMLTCRYEHTDDPAVMVVVGCELRWFDADYPPLELLKKRGGA